MTPWFLSMWCDVDRKVIEVLGSSSGIVRPRLTEGNHEMMCTACLLTQYFDIIKFVLQLMPYCLLHNSISWSAFAVMLPGTTLEALLV